MGSEVLSAIPESPSRSVAGYRSWTLWTLFNAYRWRILATYVLFNLENLLRLLQPLVLGLAINDLLQSSYRGLGWLLLQHLGHLFISTWRRMYDTRAFSAIYGDLATQLVLEQRAQEVDVSRVAARSALSRQFVDFFEQDVPVLIGGLYAILGALVMLAFYDGLLVPLCLGLLVPAWFLNRAYGRQAFWLNGRLHDQLEREVEVIQDGRPAEVRHHFRLLAGWNIRLSDKEALNFGLMELFVLALLAVALVRFGSVPGWTVGAILAAFRYLLMFLTGLDRIPQLVQQFGRLRDIGGRLQGQGCERAQP
jgi:hypothetical protein